jgi:thymidylate synthase
MVADGIGHITIEGKIIPLVWENSIELLYKYGRDIPTEYDNPGDPPSKDASIVMIITEPMTEPRIHRSFPAGIDTLFNYVNEIVMGTRDSEIGHIGYTYHDRLVNYPVGFNQLTQMIDKLKECHHTRRAQSIIWVPEIDNDSQYPPCLQRLWCRIVDNKLEMNVHMRSNDAYRAAFMNIFAFTMLQQKIASSVEVECGKYTHFVDSYHIYGSCFKEVEGFLTLKENRTFNNRVWNTEEAYYLMRGSYPMGTDQNNME